MDSGWKSGRKKHIGSVLATFPPPNRAESLRLPHLLPNLQRQLLEFGVKGVGNVIGAKCPLGKQCRQSGEHPVKRYITLPYFLQATPNRRKLLPSVLVKGNLWASTPWVSTPTENFGSMLSCSCCSWPPWDRDRAPAQLMVPANSRSIRSFCGSIIVSVLGSKPKQSILLSQKKVLSGESSWIVCSLHSYSNWPTSKRCHNQKESLLPFFFFLEPLFQILVEKHVSKENGKGGEIA